MDKDKYGKVAVLMGGQAAERDISLQSGTAVLNALQKQGVDAVKIDTAQPFCGDLLSGKFDRAFIALHGRGGEDGKLQGFLDTIGLPYTGSGVAASALGMDKQRCKQLWQGAGLATPTAYLLHADSNWDAIVAELGLPLMVKPVSEGSSIGMAMVESTAELQSAWQNAVQYDPRVIAETYIKGKEYTGAVLKIDAEHTALPLIKLQPQRRFYDFVAKYEATDTGYQCPCGLSASQEANLQQWVLNAFQLVGATAWGRIDFMIDEAGQAWLLEVNTVPGMTSHSLVPMAAQAAGIDFDALVLHILNSSLNDSKLMV